MGQKFYANPQNKKIYENEAVGYSPGGIMDCIGHFAKVKNCPINIGADNVPGLRLTCYATGYADTWFSVPACTRYRGQYIRGFFSMEETGPIFYIMDSEKPKFANLQNKEA